jgi:hypothetical protein
MRTQSDYRKLAEDCVRLAQTAKDAHYRTMFLNMSDTWLILADIAAYDHDLIVYEHAARSDKHP